MNEQSLVGIIAAMEPELILLRNQLQQLQTIKSESVIFYQGLLANKPVVLALSGIGKVNAAMTTSILIERFAPHYVINTGSAAGLGQRLQVGDVVIGTEVAHHDVDVTAFDYAWGQVPQLPKRYIADERLVNAAEKAAHVFSESQVYRGLIVSGDQFIHDDATIAVIKQHFVDVQAVEMEAAAIAQVCYQQQRPFVIIRAISDVGDGKADMSFNEFIALAGKCSAQMVKDLLANLE